jgi:hypothetical protein
MRWSSSSRQTWRGVSAASKVLPALLLGRVYAPDPETAIARAIEEFKITNPQQQKRLIASRSG